MKHHCPSYKEDQDLNKIIKSKAGEFYEEAKLCDVALLACSIQDPQCPGSDINSIRGPEERQERVRQEMT